MWTFGTQELISLIAAMSTFLAIIVSLYLAQRSRPIKFKIRAKNNKVPILTIINSGDIKFTVSMCGIRLDDKYYVYKSAAFVKNTSQVGKENPHGHQISYGSSLCEVGDLVEVKLYHFDYNLCEEAKVVKLFVVIGFKIHECSLDLKKIAAEESIMNYYEKYSKKELKNIGLFY